MSFISSIRHKQWFIKLTHWEYWSFNTIYYPLLWYWLYLSAKARSLFFFNASNPSIAFGGFLMESKWDIAQILPREFTPQTSIIRKTDSPQKLLNSVAAFQYPIICKPDMGSRGRGVAVIKNDSELLAYQQQCPLDFLLQEKINYPMEAGIFYVRMPGQANGFLTGIVEKEFLAVTGDGKATIRELLYRNKRFVLQIPQLQILLADTINDVLPAGEKRLLVPFGNHARGCRFIDSSHRINQTLTKTMDAICRMVPDFYFGRLDIRFESWEALERGENFSIIELNGAGSEPTHMYSTDWSVFDAWKEIMRHWNWLYKVSKANHERGYPYLSFAAGKKMYADNKAIDALMADFTFAVPRQEKLPELIMQ